MRLKDLQQRQSPSKTRPVRESLFDFYKSEGEYRQDIQKLDSQSLIKKQGLDSLEERIFNSELILFNLENWVDLENDLVEELSKNIKENEARILGLKQQIPDLQIESDEKQGILKNIITDLGSASNKLNASLSRMNDLESKQKEISNLIAEMEQKHNEIASDIIDKENIFDRLGKQIQQKALIVPSYDVQIEDRQVLIRNLNSEVKQKTDELVPINELVDEINDKRTRIERLEESLQNKTSELNNIQINYENTIEANKLIIQKSEQVAVRLSELHGKISSSKPQLEDWENKIGDCQIMYSDLISDIGEQDKIKQNIDKEIKDASLKLYHINNETKKAETELNDLEYRKAFKKMPISEPSPSLGFGKSTFTV